MTECDTHLDKLEERIEDRLIRKGLDSNKLKQTMASSIFGDRQSLLIGAYPHSYPHSQQRDTQLKEVKEIKNEIRKYAKENRINFLTTEGRTGDSYTNKFPKEMVSFYMYFITKQEKDTISTLLKQLC